MKKIVLLFLGILTFSYLFSQEKKLEFVEYKSKGDGYTIYFNVANLESEEQAQLILKDLLSENGISWGRYFKSGDNRDRFQLNIDSKITANYIQNILLTHNVDYDYSNVSVNGVILNPPDKPVAIEAMGSPERKLADDFPVFERTENTEQDIENYRAKKDKWIEENPEKYNQELKELEEKNKWRENN